MRTTSRLFRTVLVAAGLLAISASAAQAMPTRPSTDVGKNPGFAATGHPGGPSLNRSGFGYGGGPVVLHSSGFVLGHQLSFAAPQPMAAAADSPTNQTAPPVIAQPVAVQYANNGFDWADAAIGALVASVVLILAAVAATIVRPRQTVQL
jgi:uncharacterized membrane protein